MKKILSSITTLSLLASFSFADTSIDFVKGWNNIGFSNQYNIKQMTNEKNFKYVWYFNPVNKKWEFYSADNSLINLVKSDNIAIMPDVLPENSGVWVYADNNTTFNISNSSASNEFYPNNYVYFNNLKYAIGVKNGDLYLAKYSSDKWDNLVLLDNNFSSYNYPSIFVGENENDIVFSYIGKNENNSTAYVGTYDGEKVSKKLVTTVTNGNIYSYYGGDIFVDPDSNETRYILFETYQWDGNNQHNLIIASNNKNEWNFTNINNIYSDITINTSYINRNNGSNIKVLNKFSLITSNPLKTVIYDVNNGIHKSVELNDIWKPFMFGYYNQCCSAILVKSYRADLRGKHLALIKNNQAEIKAFDHFIVAVAVTNNELYAFGHDEIGDDLYVYKSDDNGETWKLFKEVKNFDYQIDYINNINVESDGTIYCKMRVNNYSFDIESKDSFETWNIVKNNYRKNNDSNYQNRYIKKFEKDGSITILEKN